MTPTTSRAMKVLKILLHIVHNLADFDFGYVFQVQDAKSVLNDVSSDGDT
jgi:hypothetical protein